MTFGKNLLLALAAALVSLSANAEIVDGVRQKPIPTKSPLVYDEPMYLYNVGAKAFFVPGEPYETRAQLNDVGTEVTIVDNGDGTFLLKDYVPKFKKVLCTFADGWDSDDEDDLPDGNVWCDNDGHEGRFWTVAKTGNDIYRISIASTVSYAEKWPNTFLGVKLGGADPLLYWNLTADQGDIDWYFVTVADKEKLVGAIEIYNLAQTLKALIDEAKAAGVDVSAQEAVYLDESATTDELNTAIQAIKDALAALEEGKVTADQPVDKTTLITNPSYDNNNNDGWSGDKPAFQSWTDAEFYKKKFNTYQKITTAPKGVYALSVQAFYRSGFSDAAYDNYKNITGYDAKLYAISGTDTLTANVVNPFSEALTEPLGMNESKVEDGGVTYYIPNNMETAEAYFNKGLYNNTVFFSTEDGDMTIGMRKENSETPDGNWVLYDNWGLKYYGNGADAYTLWLNEVKKSAPDYSTLSSDVLVTVGMVDTYVSTINALASANNKADVLAAIATIKAEVAKVDDNIAAWKAYQEAITRGEAIANDDQVGGPDKDDLADYLSYEAEDNIQNLTLTTVEVKSETEKLLAMIDAAIKNGISAGTDVTEKYLVNADFEVKDKGWTVNKASGGNVAYGGTSTNKCFEAWNNSNFDIYQEVSGAPVGVYEISVQGFYRYGRGATAYDAYINGTAPNDAVNIYVNNRNAHFKSVFDEPVTYGELYEDKGDNKPYVDPNEEYWYPNDMAAGSTAFANGMYKATSFGVVANAGDVLRIGVKGNTSQLGDSWAIWDNFKMVFRGTDAEVVKPLLGDMIVDVQAAIDNLNADGNAVGKNAYDNAIAAIETGNTAYGGTDGKAMFEALCAILAANEALEKSIATFATLTAKVEELQAAYFNSSASETVKAEASALSNTINEGIANRTYNDEDVAGLIEQIDALIIKLAIPAEAENASDNNPVTMTSLIKSASFDDGEGGNSIAGWNGTEGYNFGNDATQKGALALEFYNKKFDLNQTIKGLPNGTYKITVTAFYRAGSTTDDYKEYSANGNANSNAFLYAVTNDTVKAPVTLLSSGACEDMGVTGVTNIEDTELYVPNDMVSATAYFTDLEKYLNEIVVKVTDQILTLGMKKDVTLSSGNDWVIMDNWTLTYYGPNSSLGTAIESVNNSQPAKVEIYNLNGIRMSTFAKGINIIKMTAADGSVTVKKVNIK